MNTWRKRSEDSVGNLGVCFDKRHKHNSPFLGKEGFQGIGRDHINPFEDSLFFKVIYI